MPTYSVMYAGAGGGGADEDAEVLQTPVRMVETEEEDMERDGSRGVSSSRDSGIGRGKGRGDLSSGTRQRENWSADERNENVQYYHIASGGSSGDQSGSGTDWETGSSSSWWGTHYNENWSWGPRRGWSNYASNWEWVQSPDPWADWYQSRQGHDHGHGRRVANHGDSPPSDHGSSGQGDSHGSLRRVQPGRNRGAEQDMSPTSPAAAARDVTGSLPSGEIGSAGDQKEPPAAGERRGKTSSSYPPIFRAKPGESYKEWRRSVDCWLGGEGNTIPGS